MLKLVDITKEYKTEEESVFALRGVSVEFRKSEFVSILGPSGCGKTTLLNIVGGLDRYTSGDIQVDGVSTTRYRDEDWDTYRNRRIGFVFQSYNLIPHMNVLKNVQLSLTLAGISKEEGRERAMEALRKVGLEKQAKKKPNQMSGGQMQRVAIARALVNDPDIILADEPTGALDSESGLQVMELLKEVARDRLVVMVTHNGQLAEEYSTRIINLKDGEIVGDTMPYDSEAEAAAEDLARISDAVDETAPTAPESAEESGVAEKRIFTEDGVEIAGTDASTAVLSENVQESETSPSPAPPAKKRNIFKRIGDRIRAFRKREKSYMSVATAVNLSWTNLLSKKGRTLLTSIAGSIGIIGIVVVLALSNGVGAYIAGLEENALSQYPITIESESVDFSQLIDLVLGADNSTGEAYPDNDEVKVDVVLGNLLAELLYGDLRTRNDLTALKAYLDAHEEEISDMGVVKYEYGTTLNIYADDPANDKKYMKVNPFLDAMPSDLPESIAGMAENFGAGWDEISADQGLLDRQYDLVGGGSRWPQAANEIVIVVDEYNALPDFAMFILGLRSTEDLMDVIGGATDSPFYDSIDISDLIGKEYKVVSDAEYYRTQNEDGEWEYTNEDPMDRSVLDKATVDAMDSVTLKVVGVVRPKKGVTVTSINGYVGYTRELSELMLQKAEASGPAQAQINAALAAAKPDADGTPAIEVTEENFKPYVSAIGMSGVFYDGASVSVPEEGRVVTAGVTTVENYSMHVEMLRKLGVADVDTPQTIKIYSHSFDSKADIEAFLERYTAETGNPVKYSDQLAIMMTFVEQMSSTVTQVLVGFAAISLIVSTIMIAIIIYTSVLERRKEIGVLRSLGARKKDISRVFIAESAILGAYSGLIGIIVAVAISFAGSAILAAVLGISGLMQASWWQCIAMFFISILLSVLAGFIPSRIASKKDPTVALRSE